LGKAFAQGPQQGVAVHAGHVHIADHHGDALALQYGQRRFAITCLQIIVAAQRQRIGQRLAQCAVVLDQQNAWLAHTALPPTFPDNTGNTSSAQVPWPCRLRSMNAPPWAWATDFTTDTPRPVP